jgi:NAD(P)-dependent dehydrogenase (short-subunit alcohol dehydrogenase family)
VTLLRYKDALILFVSMQEQLSKQSAHGLRSEKRLDGKNVMIIGGGSKENKYNLVANGEAAAILAGREGARVAVVDIDKDAADRTVDAIIKENNHAISISADAAEENECQEAVSRVLNAFGSIEGAVINVGIGLGIGSAGTDSEAWDKVLAVNLKAHFLMAKTLLPKMKEGSIVFIGSVAGLKPGTFSPSYDASKAGLIALSKHVAFEAAGRGIRANVVAPGLIDSPLGRRVSEINKVRDKIPIPLRRQGTAWEAAWLTIFLLSDEAQYITGQTMVVDGGLSTLI